MTRLFALLALCCWSAIALAQAYPAKPVTLIIPFPPGGSTDIIGRIAADGMARELGQPLVVDNRGGAGGAIGAKAIADAAPDGYTLGIATISTHVVNPIVRTDLRYDSLKDFSFISQIAAVPNVVSIHPSVPAQNMAEFIDYARKNPGKLNFGTPGIGSLGHLLGETFKYSAKVNLTHVPYRGAGPALNDALGGQVQVLFDNLPSSLPHIQAGKLRALAVGNDKRVASIPDVPTFAETGHPLVNDPSWFGLIGPARLPAEVISRVHAALVATLRQPEAAKRLLDNASVPVGNSPEAFRKVVSDALDNTRKVVREANLKFE
ncbi:MAG: tripartite tricarboxylate transporter substrate binding protein BugE [Betaproteobacteria bacterium]|nr:MAG: tripartite tricarboxylate transporter substrate binding protein BugE [Betaproteobacteria bacterium]